MRIKYVLKPLALSALAVGLLFVGTPAVHAAQNNDARQGYKQRDDRGGQRGDDRGQQYKHKNSQNNRNDRMDGRHDNRRDRMDGRHDNRSEQGEKMGKPRYDKDKGDRRGSRGDGMGRQRDDRRAPGDGQMNRRMNGQPDGQDRRAPRDMQQRGSQNGQRPAGRPADNDDVRN